MIPLSRCILLHAVAILAIAGIAEPSAAQSSELRVRLTGEPNGSLGGALVALVDSANVVRAESLSNDRGFVTLRAMPGRFRVRVRRIGYKPFLSDPVRIPRSSELVLPLRSDRVVLATIVVSAKAECGTVGADAATLAEVWDEIAKALRASQLTAADLSSIGRSAVYDREIDSRGVVIVADTSIIPASRGRPFGAIDPASLVKDGYVRGNEAKGWHYFGPDEAVLLSRGFAETHCFRVVRDKQRVGQIGVAFEPIPRRRLPDISGTVWLDEQSSELREITFLYVNEDVVSRFRPGGFTRFRRMPSGTWIVNEWRLRMPKLARRAGSWQNDLIGYVERGGRIVGPPPV